MQDDPKRIAQTNMINRITALIEETGTALTAVEVVGALALVQADLTTRMVMAKYAPKPQERVDKPLIVTPGFGGKVGH